MDQRLERLLSSYYAESSGGADKARSKKDKKKKKKDKDKDKAEEEPNKGQEGQPDAEEEEQPKEYVELGSGVRLFKSTPRGLSIKARTGELSAAWVWARVMWCAGAKTVTVGAWHCGVSGSERQGQRRAWQGMILVAVLGSSQSLCPHMCSYITCGKQAMCPP